MYCTSCGKAVPAGAKFCVECGRQVKAPERPSQDGEVNVTGGLIPYRNLPALFGYYTAVFSLIPILGMPLSVIAMILGGVGLAREKRNPDVRGGIHSWVAIILGLVTLVAWIALLVYILGRSRW